MPSAQDIGQRLADAARPVLMLDACAVLDIVRSLARGETTATVEAAAVFRAYQGGICRLVRGSVTAAEVGEHMGQARGELCGYLERLESGVLGADRLCHLLGAPQSGANTTSWSATLPPLAEQLASNILGFSDEVDREDVRYIRAMQRVVVKRAPAARKSEAKDALLVEEFLDVARSARNGGLTAPIVLLTSNFTDFCDVEHKSRVHPQLASDFHPLGIALSLKWSHARHLMGA